MARLVLWLERDLSRSLSRHSELMSVSSDQPLRFSGKWREFPFHSQTLMTMWTVIIRSDATCHRRGFPGNSLARMSPTALEEARATHATLTHH